MSMTNINDIQKTSNILKGIRSLAVSALVGASIIVNPVDAVSSGGRGGGSSFRSSSSTRAYSSPRTSSSYSGSVSRTYIAPTIITPYYSPYGYSGFSPFRMSDVFIYGGIACLVYLALQNRIGGSDFSNSDGSGALGSGSTVMKLQISLDSNWREGNIMQNLALIAEKNGRLTSRGDISQLLSDTSIALLRCQSSWNAVAYEGEKYNNFNNQQTESSYQKLVVKERAKFEKETESAIMLKGTVKNDIVAPTQAVVSIVVAFRGKSNAYTKSIRSLVDLKNCLENLASDALTDEGENVMAVEVLWTPSEPGTVLSKMDLIQDYPELIQL